MHGIMQHEIFSSSPAEMPRIIRDYESTCRQWGTHGRE